MDYVAIFVVFTIQYVILLLHACSISINKRLMIKNGNLKKMIQIVLRVG